MHACITVYCCPRSFAPKRYKIPIALHSLNVLVPVQRETLFIKLVKTATMIAEVKLNILLH